MGADQDFAAFVAARGTSLFRLACLLTGSPTEADDLVQDSLEKVYLRWSRVSGAEAPYPYVRRLMVNTLVSTHRRRARRAEVLHAAPPEAPVESRERAVVDHEQVWPLVLALPAKQRAVIVLRYYEDLSEQQIADVLGCSTGSVKSQAHDALAALRRGMTTTAEGGVVA
jgi:RNA polymerase sigma-70 factor (sigma-E family)